METTKKVDRAPGPPSDRTYLARCTKCGKSKRFYTIQGVNGFKLDHIGHEVIVEGPAEEEESMPVVSRAEPKPMEHPMERREEKNEEKPEYAKEEKNTTALSAVKLERLDVKAVLSNVDDSMYFVVTGTGPGGIAFTIDFPLAKAREVRDFIKHGSHTATENGVEREFKWTAEELLTDSEVSSLLGIRLEEAPAGGSTMPGVKVGAPIPAETEKHAEAAPSAPEQGPEAEHRPSVEGPREEGKGEWLLVADSFYVKDDAEVQKEALRISRALREMKWGVEPPYLISVMLEDNVGIEANEEAIKTDLVSKMGQIGYRFVAVNAPKGKPTAWFKRGEEEGSVGSAKLARAENVMRELEALKGDLALERGRLQEERAAWDETKAAFFRQLKDLLAASEGKTEETAKE